MGGVMSVCLCNGDPTTQPPINQVRGRGSLGYESNAPDVLEMLSELVPVGSIDQSWSRWDL